MLISSTPSPSLRQSGTCPRELLLGAACHTGVETRPGLPGRSQPMHTKRETVFTCLPDAMLINSTTLTMTRMSLSRTALRGMWALVSAVQLLQQPADLKWSPSCFFYLNLAKKSAGQPTQKLKLGSYILYTPCKFLNTGMHEGLGNGALAQSPQR